MFEFLASLGWFEIAFFAILFIALTFGTLFDRAGREGPKWYILGVGFIAFVGYYWKDFTFGSLWQLALTWAFWKPVVIYLGIGLVYSGLEFFLDIRRSARYYADQWRRHLAKGQTFPKLDGVGVPIRGLKLDSQGKPVMATSPNPKAGRHSPDEPATITEPVMEVLTRQGTIGESYTIVAKDGAASGEFNRVNQWSKDFIGQYQFRNRIIGLVLSDEDKVTVEPKVNRVELAEHIGAWTFLWPTYAMSLICGRLLTEAFRLAADFFAWVSGRFVRLSFKNVFKF
jgi:hypothetical protein